MLPEEEDDTASVVSSMDGSTISDFGEPGKNGNKILFKDLKVT